jgi:hypothetical protein
MRAYCTLTAILIALSLGLFPTHSIGAAPPTTQRQWQYASLLISTRLSKWTSPDIALIEEGDRGYAKLYADLGGKKPADKVSTIDLFNLVGEQGWELVTVDGGEGPHQYIFKRTAQ